MVRRNEIVRNEKNESQWLSSFHQSRHTLCREENYSSIENKIDQDANDQWCQCNAKKWAAMEKARRS
jgi:hypothetical protein